MQAAEARHPWEGEELERLRDLLDQGRVKLGVHIRKMNSPGSPVYRYGENIWPAALILTSSFLATALVHFYLGAAVLAVGCWWWIAKVLPRVKDGVFDRSAAYALADPARFDLLWSRGVLSLYAKLPDGAERVATRRDDWRAYVRSFHEDTP
ncbi:hypothetical protein [Rubritepida flocculans]|uniref:hypothetical protein n=1 Tax=Rubritepida flocculans TaxID=182403 RepID=UPI00042A0F91|nr:hypothetical protein [Rubritepida flocculans]